MSIEKSSGLQKLREKCELLRLATLRVAVSNDVEYSTFGDVMKAFDIDEDQ